MKLLSAFAALAVLATVLTSCTSLDPRDPISTTAPSPASTPITVPTPSGTIVSENQAKPNPDCGDYLKKADVTHPALKFVSCERDTRNVQAVSYIATYEVAGNKAKEIEKLFMRRFGMKKLKFVCCGWANDSDRIQFRDQENKSISVWMGSGETLEKDWNKIPKFMVTLERWMTDP